MTLLTSFLNLVYPPLCGFCRARVDEDFMICFECWPKLHFITDPFCQTCALPLTIACEEEIQCAQCILTPPDYKQARAVFAYDLRVKQLVLRFKNAKATALARFMGQYMGEKAASLIDASDYIVPVPLHPSRLKMRGFNQSTLLAQQLAKPFPKKLQSSLLCRKKNTPSQGGLSASARKKNVEKAFALKDGLHPTFLKNKSILLVDDVMTTGATLNSCARVLLNAGALEVNVVVFSRSVR